MVRPDVVDVRCWFAAHNTERVTGEVRSAQRPPSRVVPPACSRAACPIPCALSLVNCRLMSGAVASFDERRATGSCARSFGCHRHTVSPSRPESALSRRSAANPITTPSPNLRLCAAPCPHVSV